MPEVVVRVPEHLETSDEPGKELTGDLYDELVEEGDLDNDISIGMDIVVYTSTEKGRPWTGRVLSLLDNKKFLIHWFSRKTIRSNIFYAQTNADGSNIISEQENGVVMFWEMSTNRTPTSFKLSNYWLEIIKNEYERLDSEC